MRGYIISTFFILFSGFLFAQSKTILHGRDKTQDSIAVNTGDKYYDSGGPGGSRLPDQPGNYFNCSNPFDELSSANCTSLFTFCSSAGDTVALNFNDYYIITGDRLRVYSGKTPTGPYLYNSVNNGVTINGMRLTTGTFLKSKSPDGCITVEWFATTIGNGIGWDADFIVIKKNAKADKCTPVCNSEVVVTLPLDTCYTTIKLNQFENSLEQECKHNIQLFYPTGSDHFQNLAVNSSHVNKRFLYQITDSASQSSCVGYLSVKESNFQAPECAVDTISCIEWDQTFKNLKKVMPCKNKGYTIKSQTFTPLSCDDNIIGYVIRNIELMADSTSSSCTDTFYISRATFTSLLKPADIELACDGKFLNPSILTPDYIRQELDKDGDSKIDFTNVLIEPLIEGYPIGDTTSFCSVKKKYNDFVITNCGNTFKIRRQWTISNACSGRDSSFIQYIELKDENIQLNTSLQPVEYQVENSTCIANITLDSISGIEDCNKITQKAEIAYVDPKDPARMIVINAVVPIKLNLMPGAYKVKYTISDACFNQITKEQCIWVYQNYLTEYKGKNKLVAYLEPQTCWSRIYAADLKESQTLQCSSTDHYALASQDSITFYTHYWQTQIQNSCGTTEFQSNQAYYAELIDKWINTYVFSDYVDLTACHTHSLVLRILNTTGLPVSKSVSSCSAHKMRAYFLDPFYRIQVDGSKNCNAKYIIECKSKMDSLLSAAINQFTYLSSLNLDTTCATIYFKETAKRAFDKKLDVSIWIEVKDSLIPQLPQLQDVVFYTNDINTTCVTNSYAPNQWPGTITCKNCDSTQVVRYYGGPVHSSVVYDSLNNYSYPGCNEYTPSTKPLYCVENISNFVRTIPNFDSLFTKLTLNSNTNSLNEVNLEVNCAKEWSLNFKDSIIQENNCSQQGHFRVWSLISACGDTQYTSQKLIIKRRSDFEIVFPEDKYINCDAKQITDSAEIKKIFGYPLISSSYATCLKISYRDSLVAQSKGAYCLLTQRIWTVENPQAIDPTAGSIDFILNDSMVADRTNRYCIYRSLKDGGDGIMQYRQIIRYIDNAPPVIGVQDTSILGSNCLSPSFTLPYKLKDECTPTEVISSQFRLDIHSDGMYEYSLTKDTSVLFIPGDLPPGIHTLQTIAGDLCGNIDTTKTKIIIIDDGTPMAFCVQSAVLITIKESKQAIVFAKDFDAGSLAGCEKGPLKFSFTAAIKDSTQTYTCDSIGDKSVKVWITNTAQKQSTCHIKLQVVADANACIKDTSTQNIQVEGKVLNLVKNGISKVAVKSNDPIKNAITDLLGKYNLPAVEKGRNLIIRPEKINDPLNGLSSIDLLMMEGHIKGLSPLTDPYQIIAADVNKSGSITITDLVELRRLILGATNTLSNHKDWVFIPAAHKFNDPLQPWPYPETLIFNPISNSISDADFIGIKIGDLNASATVGFAPLETRSSLHSFHLELKSLGGEKYGLFPTKNARMNALQLSIIGSFSNTELVINEGNHEIISTSSGAKIIWHKFEGFPLSTIHPIITFYSKNVQSIQLSAELDPMLVIEDKMFNPSIQQAKRDFLTSISIYPNPSTDKICIEFYCNDFQREQIQFTNHLGKILNLKLPAIRQGFNHIYLNKSDLGGPGQFYFSRKNGSHQNILKFIIL